MKEKLTREELLRKYENVNERSVEWYRVHGKHPDRIMRSPALGEFVCGDWSWNRHYPKRQEYIERKMEIDLGLEAPSKRLSRPPEVSTRNTEIRRLRGQGQTLQAIANKFGLTRERIRQIVSEQ